MRLDKMLIDIAKKLHQIDYHLFRVFLSFEKYAELHKYCGCQDRKPEIILAVPPDIRTLAKPFSDDPSELTDSQISVRPSELLSGGNMILEKTDRKTGKIEIDYLSPDQID